MTDRRALLTDREREIVAGDADVSDSYRYQTISRVRARFDRLADDLAALEDHGDLATELRAIVCDAESAPEPAVTTPEDRADQSDAPPATDATAPTDADESGDIVDAVAENWDDSDDRLDARKAAARGVLAYMREHGTVSKQEAKEEVRPEYPVEGQNARTWYRKNIRPVLNEVAEYDQSARAYRLVDDLDDGGA